MPFQYSEFFNFILLASSDSDKHMLLAKSENKDSPVTAGEK